MTKDDIIEMAKKVGLVRAGDGWTEPARLGLTQIECFARLVAAAEREVCAVVCDELHWPWRMGDNSGPKDCAVAIRARSQS